MHVMLVGPEFEENLSLRYLAAALQASGHTASLARFDSAEHIGGVVQQALREQPGMIGLSMVFQVRAREFMELARELKRSGYSGHITAGGHFATFAFEPLMNAVPEFDSIVRQEGEQTLSELAGAVETGGDLRGIAGLVVRGEDGAPFAMPARQQVALLDNLPFPVRSQQLERHLGVPTAFLVGSRGCYADCEYCSIFAWHEAAIGKRYRMRSVGNIAEEMEWLYRERGARFFVFHDDNFFLPKAEGNRKRFTALRDEIDRRNLTGIGLMLKLRPNDCDRENMVLLKQMGLMRGFVGIENASQRQLRSLGRDSTVEDVNACLSMLKELDIFATYNILLFDPYTTLDDVETNLAFLRQNLWFPFNWCKVEPYAGTELVKRYAREGRLRGDYLGHDYDMDDPRAALLYDLLVRAFYYRNFDYFGLANLNIGLGYHRQLLKQFYPERATQALCDEVQQVIESINRDTIALIEQACQFARTVDPADTAALDRFSDAVRQQAFDSQHRLGTAAEEQFRRIEQAAGVHSATRAGRSEAFTPLNPPREKEPKGVTRRRGLAAVAAGAAWLLAACGKKQPTAKYGAAPPASTPYPEGRIDAAPGSGGAAPAGKPLELEARLVGPELPIIGDPRVTCSGGTVSSVATDFGARSLRITYMPGGGSTELDPNVTISVAWTVRGAEADSVVVARSFLHVNADGSYALGYVTPRPTIAEMAAPPIRQGPIPSGSGGSGRGGGTRGASG